MIKYIEDIVSERITRSMAEHESQSSEESNTLAQKSGGSIYTPPHGRGYNPKNLRGTIEVMTPEVVGAFDKCGVSYRNSVYLIGTVAHALGIDVEELILNKNSFNNARAKLRKKKAEKLKLLFQEKMYLMLWYIGTAR